MSDQRERLHRPPLKGHGDGGTRKNRRPNAGFNEGKHKGWIANGRPKLTISGVNAGKPIRERAAPVMIEKIQRTQLFNRIGITGR